MLFKLRKFLILKFLFYLNINLFLNLHETNSTLFEDYYAAKYTLSKVRA